MEMIKDRYQASGEADAWNESSNLYTVSGQVERAKNCFAYAATNLGDTIVDVNGHRLFPSATPATEVGDSISLSAPEGQVFKGNLTVQFQAPVGAAPLVEITQLFYLNDKQNK